MATGLSLVMNGYCRVSDNCPVLMKGYPCKIDQLLGRARLNVVRIVSERNISSLHHLNHVNRDLGIPPFFCCILFENDRKAFVCASYILTLIRTQVGVQTMRFAT